MKIQNKTKKTTLSSDATLCPSLFQKARGLMFRSQQDLIFIEQKEKYIPLHMFFVFYPIDVIYCNSEKKVIELKEKFLPWTFYSPQKRAMFVLELKAGTISKTETAINDYLAFE